MKRLLAVSLLAAALPAAVFAAEAPSADPAPAVELRSNSFYDAWIKDRLSVGLGVSWSILTSPKRPNDVEHHKTFVGFVSKLEDDDQFRVFPEIRYWAADWIRLVLSLDQVSGRTRNYNMPHSDGSAEMYGPQFLVEGLYPMCDDTVFLHAGVGFVYGFGDFSEVKWWKLGYSSEADWASIGRPNKAREHYWREIEVDDTFGLSVSAGVSWRPIPDAELDLSIRHTWIEPDCDFGYRRGGQFSSQADGEFTLDHLTVALSASYVF